MGSVDLIGPGVGVHAETSDLRKLKTASTTHAPRGLLVDGDLAAQIEIDAGECGPINRHGMVVAVTNVIRSTGRGWTRDIVGKKIHLCRQHPCPAQDTVARHFTIYATVGSGVDVDIYALAPGSWWSRYMRHVVACAYWMLVSAPCRLVWLVAVYPVLALGRRCGCCCCRRRRAHTPEPSAETRKPAALRAAAQGRSADSETEEEHDDCVAHTVRWLGVDDTEVLTAFGQCTAAAQPGTTVLLDEDRAASSMKENGIKLCATHAALYLQQRGLKRCSSDGCQRLGAAKVMGVALCQAHADALRLAAAPPAADKVAEVKVAERQARDAEADEEGDPHAKPRRPRKATPSPRRRQEEDSPEWERLGEAPRTPRAATRGVSELAAKIGLRSPETVASERPLLVEYLQARAEGQCVDDGGTVAWLAATKGRTAKEVMEQLIEEAECERRDGARGLSGLLTAWKQRLAPSTTGRAAAQYPRSRSSSPAWPPPPPGLTGLYAARTASPFPPAPALRVNFGSVAPTAVPSLVPTNQTDSASIYDTFVSGAAAKERRMAGAEGVGDPILYELARAMKDQSTDLAALAKSQIEEKVPVKGTVKGLGREEEELVFLARACGAHRITVCPVELGKNLFGSLKQAAIGASTKLREVGWTATMKNRLALGLAGGYWGARSQAQTQSWSLTAADFTQTTSQELDEFQVPQHENLEQRPRPPVTIDDWSKRAKRGAAVFALLYGEEYREPLTRLVSALETLHEEHPQVFPSAHIMEIYEELHWRFWEELKEVLRRAKREMGRDVVRRDDLREHCLTPQPSGHAWLVLPNTFSLEDREAWFRAEILPRVERRRSRALWQLTWAGGPKPSVPRAGGEDTTEPRVGAGGNPPPASAYPAGKPLSGAEAKLAQEHGPRDDEGKPACWSAATHQGCSKTAKECTRSHKPLKGALSSFHWTVQAQFIRRGGLKSGRRIDPKEVDGRVAQLRAAAKEEAEAKKRDGGNRRGGECLGNTNASGGAGGAATEFANMDFTAAEEPLRLVMQQQDKTWTVDAQPGGVAAGINDGELQGDLSAKKQTVEAAQARVQAEVSRLKLSEVLASYVTQRASMEPLGSVPQFLEEVVRDGLGESAAEAAAALDAQPRSGATLPAQAQVLPTHWPASGQPPGWGAIRIDGVEWTTLDFKEEITIPTDLAELLGNTEPFPERRQCLLKSVAAALLDKGGGLPQETDVAPLAVVMRQSMAEQAWEALNAIGPPDDRVSPNEAEMRTHIHDVLRPCHDKDFRVLSVFPPAQLDSLLTVVMRVTYTGTLLVEVLRGRDVQSDDEAKYIWLLIHRGHMRMARPPKDLVPAVWLQQQQAAGNLTETPIQGWQYYAQTALAGPPSVPGDVSKGCRCCKSSRASPAEEEWSTGIIRTGYLPAAARAGEVTAAVGHLQIVGEKLHLQEVCAGKGGLSRAWEAASLQASPPIDLYDCKGVRHDDMDLTQAAVQERLLAAAASPSGPNIWVLAPPCTSFCDWNRAKGNRTFDQPEGVEAKLTDQERIGNVIGEFTARLATELLKHHKWFVVENPAPSGRYPKLWDMPAWRQLLKSGAVVPTSTDQCAHGLRAIDATSENEFYRKRTWFVSPPTPGFAGAIGLPCPGTSEAHKHIPLAGRRPGSSLTRCAEAAAYPQVLCERIVRAIMEGVKCVGGGSKPAPRAATGQQPSTGSDESKRAGGETDIQWARRYNSFVTKERFANQSAEAWLGAAAIGARLVAAAGSVEDAARRLWADREATGMNNLAGVDRRELDGLIPADLLAYLRDVRAHGAAARSFGTRTKQTARPHRSALEAMPQVMKQLWKDIKTARVLVIPSACGTELCTHSSPFGAVDKQNPDRSISTEKRIVHDQRQLNGACPSSLHPPAVQPRHRQLARLILWWRGMLPKTRILVAKRDIAGAFRLIWLAPEDTELFAGDLPWDEEAAGGGSVDWKWLCDKTEEDKGALVRLNESMKEDGVTVIYLVLSFGFSGSPGEWTAWAGAAAAYHHAHRPDQTRRDGPWAFTGETLVDDHVIIEPEIGLRPWVSAAVYERGVRMLLGPGAINQEKNEMEGAFDTQQTCWGVTLDTASNTARLPERRILKGAYLLADPVYDAGNKQIRLIDLQRLRGTAQSWACVLPPLRTMLRAVDVFLGVKRNGPWVAPAVSEADEEAAWTDLWDLMSLLRLTTARPEMWEARFTSSLEGLLAPHERLALPSERHNVVFVSSDATPSTHAAIDWTGGVAAREPTGDFLRAVLAAFDVRLEHESEETNIAIGELMGYVAFAAERAEAWKNKVVLYVGDNTNVRDWLLKRHPRPRAAVFLIKVLTWLEAKYSFTTCPVYTRTYHNTTSDLYSRCSEKEFLDDLKARGFSRVDLGAKWQEVTQNARSGAVMTLLSVDPEDHRLAVQLALARSSRVINQPELGNVFLRLTEKGSKVFSEAMPASLLDEKGKRLAARAFRWTELKDFPKWATTEAAEGAQLMLAEFPSPGPGQKAKLNEEWSVREEHFLSPELGEGMARKRSAWLAVRGSREVISLESLGLRFPIAAAAAPMLTRQPTWRDDITFRLDPKLKFVRDPLLPRAEGHMWLGGRKRLLPGLAGPVPAVHSSDLTPSVIVWDPAAAAGCLRSLGPSDLIQLLGHNAEGLQAERATDLLASTSPLVASRLLVWAAANASSTDEPKVGGPRDEDANKAADTTRRWMQEWQRGSFARIPPRRCGGGDGRQAETERRWVYECLLWVALRDSLSRAGGRTGTNEASRRSAAALIAVPSRPEPCGLMTIGGEVEEWVANTLSSRHAEGTRSTYAKGWQRWMAFATHQRWGSPYLLGESRAERLQDEEKLLSFLGYQGWLGRSVPTMKTALFAVQAAHKQGGLPDPVEGKARVWMLLEAAGKGVVQKRKLGATPQMLQCISKRHPSTRPHSGQDATGKGRIQQADDAVLLAAVTFGFFFLARASEYVQSGKLDTDKILRGADVQFKRDGVVAGPTEEPDEVTVQFRKTKTDQASFGSCRTHFKTDSELCPVRALSNLRRWFPERFKEQAGLPLFRWHSGKILQREDIQRALQVAATECGIPAERILSHSLRIGGASALYHATGDIELVKRFGRWSSGAVHSYLWESAEQFKGLSTKMANDVATLHYT